MDTIETLSDCSDSSQNSEGVSSDVSTFSSLSEYQTEFLNLRQLVTSNDGATLIDFKKHNSPKQNISPWYEQQIERLNAELKTSIIQNEKYKNDIINLDKKKDIFYAEKIDSLLKQNKQLSSNLSAANNQIQRLISIYHKQNDNTHTAFLENKIFQLEKTNHEISNQNYLLSNKINQCNFEKKEIESECKQFKAELNELHLELAAKINSTDELKKKISEQHIQLQEIIQTNVKLVHSLELTSNELEHTRKSESWYKSELRQTQHEKNIAHEKVLENEKNIALQEEKIDQLKLELNSVKCSCDEIRLTSLKEKENMLKQLEFLDKHVTNSPKKITVTSNINSDIGNISKHYETVVKDLTSDVGKIKSDFEHQQRCFESLSREKFEIVRKNVSLENCLKEKDNVITKLEKSISDLKEQVTSTISKHKEQSSQLLSVKKTCAKLKVELDLKIKDNESFEDTVNIIREQFKVFTGKHMKLKNEIFEKSKEILQLQFEKQQLSLNCSQQASEFKRYIETRSVEIEKLKQRIIYLEGLTSDVELVNNTHLKTIDEQTAEIQRLQTNFNELQAKFISSRDDSNSLMNTDLRAYPSYGMNSSVGENIPDVLDVLKSLCKFCKIIEDDVDENKSHYVKVLVNKIQSRFKFIEAEIACKSDAAIERKKKSSALYRNVIARIVKLVDRCKILEARSEENTKVLKALNCESRKDYNTSDEIQRLQTLLQVKTQEGKDKQKRYERNYRTLLRKVKEHMKGRKVAEKHNAYLQELFNTTSNECNTLKLQLNLKTSEIIDFQTQMENLSRTNEKLKLSILKLEKELSLIDSCKRCADFEIIKTTNFELKQKVKENENKSAIYTLDLKLKDELITNLQQENERMIQEISSKNAEYRQSVSVSEAFSQKNKQLCAKLSELENQLIEEKASAEELRRGTIILENNCSELQSENCQLSGRIEHMNEKNAQIRLELNHLNLRLQRKTEEISELHSRKEESTCRWQQKETNMQNLITDLKNQVHSFKDELSVIKNEKFFLQRLCSDLKVALKTHVTQNKNLKDFLEKVAKEKEKIDNKSIILSSFPSPVKNDDVYIERLLEKNRMPFQDKPFCDIQECLATLRKEILFLQKQISDKNMV